MPVIAIAIASASRCNCHFHCRCYCFYIKGRLSDDDSVDTLDDLDGPVERNKSRKTSHTSEEQSSLQSADSSMVFSCETRFVYCLLRPLLSAVLIQCISHLSTRAQYCCC